ncbi:putative porin [Acidovorax sp. 93]|uniref:porin n=1 Tax=Acidovorax sp. 93 TaxID=2135632 RepID=UPI000F1004E1|nr:porin [Acidovorax sp. 93]RKR26884.1 putative porin [Acidovorax sp. 93]
MTRHFLASTACPTSSAPYSALVCVALASLGACGTAQAQSSLTIYGIVDQGLARANGGTTPGALLPGRGVAPRVWTMKAGNTSRLGFMGREDMGGGLYSRFQIEHRFAADTGAPSNPSIYWLGRSVVAVGSKQWGEVYAGREYSAAYTVALNADPTYWSYVSQLGSAYTYANYTPVAAPAEASNIRWANAVGYKSPVISGVSMEIAGAFGEGVRSNATSGNLQYKNGPVWVGAAFDRLDSSTHLALVAGGYDFGMVHTKASYSRAKGGVNGDATAYSVSAMVPLSFGRTYLMVGHLKPATQLDSQMIGAGLQYDLSKRTLLYTNLGTAKRYGLTRTTAIDFGVKHTF